MTSSTQRPYILGPMTTRLQTTAPLNQHISQARSGVETRLPRPAAAITGLLLALACLTGCPATQTLPDQAPIQELAEPGQNRAYLLYVPSIYTKERNWPLVVACHGTWPYDSAEAQMREWAKFAEYEGIIVAAPKLVSSKGDFPPPAVQQIEQQEEDERAIVSMVADIQRRYSVDQSKIFLTGWSAAAYPILYTGIRHPDIFRAMFIRQGTFNEDFMPLAGAQISKWQQIKLTYGRNDFLRDQAVACAKWLRDNGAWVEEQELTGAHRRTDPKFAWDFFEKIIRERPWIQINASRPHGGEPLAMSFRVETSPQLLKQKWLFGDGHESYAESPTHVYEKPGRYKVRVNVSLEGGKTYTRTKQVNVVRVLGAPD